MFTKAKEGAPNQCQAALKNKQCPFEAIKGFPYCQLHGGTRLEEKAKESRKRIYQISQWQARVNEFADHEEVKSLREEIGITRLLLESMLNICKDQHQLLIYSSKISETVMKLEKLVSSCHRLEQSSGLLLDKSAVLSLAGAMVDIIGKHITDENAMDAISTELMTLIMKSSNLVEKAKELENKS